MRNNWTSARCNTKLTGAIVFCAVLDELLMFNRIRAFFLGRCLVPHRFYRIVVACVCVVVGAISFVWPWGGALVHAQTAQRVVYVVPIEGNIDLGLAPFVERVLGEAQQANAAFVILEINTFGGRVDGAVLIRDALLRARVPTVAFVNKRAISAGALISLAANQIAMAEGGTIGAAMPVQMGEPGGKASAVDEKTVSYVRKEFRATAEARNRPARIAEAMVDADVEIEGVIEKGKLLTLTTDEALANKVADFRANDLDAVLAHLEVGNAELRRGTVNWAENVLRFLTNPILGSLLISIGILGILLEMRTPGFGIPGVVGITSLALFFWGHWIVRLAGLEELILVGAGLILLALEAFVIPGFGVAGILGIVSLLAGLSMSLFGAGANMQAALSAITQVLFALIIGGGAAILLFRWMPRSWLGRGLVLDTEPSVHPGKESDFASSSSSVVAGQTGMTVTMLRPSGIAEINGQRVDVVADGQYISAGVVIRVGRVEGHRVVVHPISPTTHEV